MRFETGVSDTVGATLLVTVSVFLIFVISGQVFDLSPTNLSVGSGKTEVDVVKNPNGDVTVLVTQISSDKVVVKYNSSKYNLTRVGSEITLNPTGDPNITVYSVTGSQETLLRTITFRESFVNLEPSGSSVEYITWNSSAEWNNAVSEFGVVHERVSNTDHDNASIVKKGYSLKNPVAEASLVGYWPLQEDSGTTAYDFSGNNHDGSNNGASVNQAGLVGTSGYHHGGGGTSDYIAADDNGDNSEWYPASLTAMVWVKPDNTNDWHRIIEAGRTFGGSDSEMWLIRWNQNNYHEFGVRVGGSYYMASMGSSLPANEWSLVIGTYDGETMRFYVDGNLVASNSNPSGAVDVDNDKIQIGAGGGSPETLSGELWNARFYNTALSSTQVQNLNDMIRKNSTLTTSSKSFSSSAKPDLTNLSYTLNNGTVYVDVIGSPGTASEEVNTVKLDGATLYDLTWANSHTKFRIKLYLNHSNIRKSPQVSKIRLKST